MVPKFQVATACFSCPPDLNSSKWSSTALKVKNYFSKLYVHTNSEINILPALSQATAYNHPKLVSEGRGAEAWESSNKRCFVPPHIKMSVIFPGRFSVTLLSY
jgi:hypothetical protein